MKIRFVAAALTSCAVIFIAAAPPATAREADRADTAQSPNPKFFLFEIIENLVAGAQQGCPACNPTPAPKPAARPAPKGPFYVQVLATKDAARADELAKRLKGEGFSADVAVIPAKPGWFRVHVGPIKDRAKAEALAKKIKAADKQIKNVPLVVP